MLRKPSSTRSIRPTKPEGVDPLRAFELAVEAAKALAWPSLVLAAAIAFSEPLNIAARGLATKIDDANKVSIGSFSVEIEAKVRASTNPELARRVGNLSPQSLEQLMRTNHSGGNQLLSTMRQAGDAKLGLPASDEMAALRELEEKGLLKFHQPLKPFLAQLKVRIQPPGHFSNPHPTAAKQPQRLL